MNYPQGLESIITQCEIVSDELEGFDPGHNLLKFDGTGCTSQELDILTDLLMFEFGPPGYNSDSPSDEELIFTYSALLLALNVAVIIQKAKHGIFKPL